MVPGIKPGALEMQVKCLHSELSPWPQKDLFLNLTTASFSKQQVIFLRFGIYFYLSTVFSGGILEGKGIV